MAYALSDFTGSEKVHIQSDWIVVNWHRTPGAVYPRWPSRWATFAHCVDVLQNCLGRGLRFGRAEVTYVNHIPMRFAYEAFRIFSFMAPTDGYLVPPLGQLYAHLVYPINWPNAPEWQGRLNVSVASGQETEAGQPSLSMVLTATGRPRAETLGGLHDFAALARERVVRSFVGLTTPEMHAVWGRER